MVNRRSAQPAETHQIRIGGNNAASVVSAWSSVKRFFNALRISRTSRRCARAVFVSRPWMIGLPRGIGVLFKIAIAPPEIPNNRGLASINLDVLDGNYLT